MDRQPIIPLVVGRRGGNRQEAIGGELGYPNGSNVFIQNAFVVLTAGNLAALATGAVLAGGFAVSASVASTDIDPPYAFFGDRHWPIALRGTRFAITVTDASGNIGEAAGAPQLSEITVGSSYGVYKASDGSHQLNVDETSNTIFTVVEKPELFDGVEQDADTYNPVVIVEVIESKQQLLG